MASGSGRPAALSGLAPAGMLRMGDPTNAIRGQASATPMFTGALIASVAGALTLVIFGFGGWAVTESYAYTEGLTIYRTFAEGLSVDGVIGWVFAIVLLYGAFVAYRGRRSGGADVSAAQIRRAFWVTLAVFALVIAGGAVFLAVLAGEDVEDYWLDAGFYGGLIGSGLAAMFFHLARRNLLEDRGSLPTG